MNDPTGDPICIRPAAPADAASVLGLFEQHLAAIGAHPDPVLDFDMADFPTVYARQGQFLVADHAQGGIVGMAGLLSGEIRRLFVTEPWRGQHIARRLIARLMRSGPWPTDGRLTAVIASGNHASRRAFEACGFVGAPPTPSDSSASPCTVYECRLAFGSRPGISHRLVA